MYFLIHYHRPTQTLIRYAEYAYEKDCNDDRLRLELLYISSLKSNEIVTFKSDSKESLMKTHGRYFKEAYK